VAQPTLKNPPAVTPPLTPAKIANKKQEKFITILKNDHNYDIIAEIIDHIKVLSRAKKIKPVEKHRMIIQYHAMLLPFCLTKVKAVEDDTGGTGGKGVIFNITIGEDTSLRDAGNGRVTKGRKGVSVSIPTQKQDDGTYTVSDG
jgi:hypothetical protein